MTEDPLCDSAITNALSSIRKEAHLPNQIFTQAWDEYLFFESYMMFDAIFIETKNIILNEEEYSKIAVINLGNLPNDSDREPRSICLDKETTFPEYISILKGDGSPLNWMFLMDRYVCASNKGNWCIYCEKENDIAVLATRHAFPASVLLNLRNLLKANSIKTIDNSKMDHKFFDFNKLVSSWKAALVANYGH